MAEPWTCTRSHPHEPTSLCDGDVRHLYAKGVHDERERIIALLSAEPVDGVTFRLNCRLHGHDRFLTGDWLRAAIEPDPKP